MSVDAHIEQTRSPRLLRRSFAGVLVTLIMIVLTFLAIFAASLYEAGRQNAVSRTAALEQYVRRSLEVSDVIARDALGYLHRRGSLEGLGEDYDAHLYFSTRISHLASLIDAIDRRLCHKNQCVGRMWGRGIWQTRRVIRLMAL